MHACRVDYFHLYHMITKLSNLQNTEGVKLYHPGGVYCVSLAETMIYIFRLPWFE